MLFQELCSAKVNWDEPLLGDLLYKWRSLVSNFQAISIPRCYLSSSEDTTNQLIGFCDASANAYAAVVYLRRGTGEGSVSFIAAKTRVSPVGNKQTIPRLELLSALLLARLIVTVSIALRSEVLLEKPVYFTDSKIAMYWIKRTEQEWKPFVQNWVGVSLTLIDGSTVQERIILPISHLEDQVHLSYPQVNCGVTVPTG